MWVCGGGANGGESEYRVEGSLAPWCGGAGTVLKAKDSSTHQPLAIKRLHLETRSAAASQLLQQEILTTRQLQHPNILPYYTSFVNGLYLYIVTPLMNLGSCRDLLNKYFNNGLPEQACCIILRDVLQGLDYIHKKGFIHRGIRSSHVLVCSSGKVCLTGLRSAASLHHQGKRQRCLHALPPVDNNNMSLLWLSPELLEQNLRGYDEKSDIYSMGMLTCEMANGVIPFCGVPTTLMLTEKVRGNAPQLLDSTTINNFKSHNNYDESGMDDASQDGSSASGSRQHMTDAFAVRRFSNAFHQFTELCLKRESTTRPSCSQLLAHNFFKQANKLDCLAQILHEARPIDDETNCKACNLSEILLEERMNEMEIGNSCEWDF